MDPILKNLPPWTREKLATGPGHKDWMQCRSCHVYKDVAVLKKCGGCAAYRISPIYYCSKECQKSDWLSHKDDCRIFREQGKLQEAMSVSETEGTVKLRKLIIQWSWRNTQIVEWTMAHAYHYNKYADPSKVAFVLLLDIVTFEILSFGFLAKNDPSFRGMFSDPHLAHLQGKDKQWFCSMVNHSITGPPDYVFNMEWSPIRERALALIRDDPGAPFIEWAWIGKHLSRGNEQRRWVAKIKWNFLVAYIDLLHKKRDGSLEDFKTPKLEIGVLFSPTDMNIWYEKINQRYIWDVMDRCGYVQKTFTHFAGEK